MLVREVNGDMSAIWFLQRSAVIRPVIEANGNILLTWLSSRYSHFKLVRDEMGVRSAIRLILRLNPVRLTQCSMPERLAILLLLASNVISHARSSVVMSSPAGLPSAMSASLTAVSRLLSGKRTKSSGFDISENSWMLLMLMVPCLLTSPVIKLLALFS